MRTALAFLLLISIAALGCQDQSKPLNPSMVSLATSDTLQMESEPLPRIDSTLELVNTCKNKSYEAKLEEFIYWDSNAFVLTITAKKKDKTLSLDLPPGRTRIESCGKNYLVLGSACGGPCFGLDFIFVQEERPAEHYMYCHIAKSNDNIIAHIEKEEFEHLKIRNLENSKEITVMIDSCENISAYPCNITKLDVSGNMLKLEFESSHSKPRQKQVDISELLK